MATNLTVFKPFKQARDLFLFGKVTTYLYIRSTRFYRWRYSITLDYINYLSDNYIEKRRYNESHGN